MSRRKTAVVVGSGGQDGRLLAQSLKADGFGVMGVTRSGPVDILDAKSVARFVARVRPAEIYYVAAYHHSAQDALRDDAELYRRSHDVNVLGLVHFLEAVRVKAPEARIFYASSSRVFGASAEPMQNERTPLSPRDAYGLTKAAGLLACRLYRERDGLFAAAGILYNHESPLREPKFLSRKLAIGAAAIKRGGSETLVLGDLAAEVDWGWAPDYVDAMRRILRHDRPDDFVVATGRKRSVRDFARAVFAEAGLDYRRHVRAAAGVLQRRTPTLVGDAAKLRRVTGWRPTVTFEEMARRLVSAELAGRRGS